ncbi:helix-turn-helix domain-containing protein [Frankia sp. Cppng1_Ct_nod]|uniref:helix-turn-helix domain-containing protein n=1 Tax=Frankia sp. Cppng1_Ct_nod TaxID=2897162 RepID=UPI002024775B|nr:helix-turn-helix domain-containing protein [Frankia sp. Cppng1_Ct_nod]
MVEDTRALPRHANVGTQLVIPGALVLMPTSDSGTPVADRSGWQRAVLRSGLPRAAKLVALAIASHSADAFSGPTRTTLPGSVAACAPGLVTLAFETGYSRTHVQRQIRLLRNLGWLIGLSRPAAGRPASFALSMSDSVRAAESATAVKVGVGETRAAKTAPAQYPQADYADGPRAGSTPGVAGRARRVTGSRAASDRPTAAARRRARITGAAMANALTVVGDFSLVTATAVPPAVPASPVPASAAAVPPAVPASPAGTLRTAEAGPIGPRRTVHPVAEAAEQVVGTLARAMRRDPQTFGAARDRLTHILSDSSWNAAELAMHLVDTVGPSLGAGRVDDPADHLLRRLDHLPASSSECLCRSCRSWIAAPAVAVRRVEVGPAVAMSAAEPDSVALPELAAIEQAAAAGAAQARVRPQRASGAA